MSQFGAVTEVAAVRNCDNSISLSKKIYEKEWKIRELTSQLTENPLNDSLREQIADLKV